MEHSGFVDPQLPGLSHALKGENHEKKGVGK